MAPNKLKKGAKSGERSLNSSQGNANHPKLRLRQRNQLAKVSVMLLLLQAKAIRQRLLLPIVLIFIKFPPAVHLFILRRYQQHQRARPL